VIAAATRVDDPVPSFDLCGEEDCCLANNVAKVQRHHVQRKRKKEREREREKARERERSAGLNTTQSCTKPDKACGTSTRYLILGISVHPTAKFGFVVHLRTKMWFSGTMLCTRWVFRTPFLGFSSSCLLVGVAPHIISAGCVVLSVSLAAGFTSDPSVCWQLVLLSFLIISQPSTRMQGCITFFFWNHLWISTNRCQRLAGAANSDALGLKWQCTGIIKPTTSKEKNFSE